MISKQLLQELHDSIQSIDKKLDTLLMAGVKPEVKASLPTSQPEKKEPAPQLRECSCCGRLTNKLTNPFYRESWIPISELGTLKPFAYNINKTRCLVALDSIDCVSKWSTMRGNKDMVKHSETYQAGVERADAAKAKAKADLEKAQGNGVNKK